MYVFSEPEVVGMGSNQQRVTWLRQVEIISHSIELHRLQELRALGGRIDTVDSNGSFNIAYDIQHAKVVGGGGGREGDGDIYIEEDWRNIDTLGEWGEEATADIKRFIHSIGIKSLCTARVGRVPVCERFK